MKYLNKMYLGYLSETPAAWLDKQNLTPAKSLFGKILQGVKNRIFFILTFPILSLFDVIVDITGYLFYKIKILFKSHESQIALCNKRAQRLKENAFKNILGFLGSPLGLINPILVYFFFVPNNKNPEKAQSGGELYEIKAQIIKPRKMSDIKKALMLAKRKNKKVSIKGAGRSQGKQFISNTPDQIVLDMKYINNISVDADKKTVKVGAGAIWGDIQSTVNKHRLAVQVMQASNVFSVGGSISTNIHGWHKAGILANTICSITIMNAQGKIIKLKPEDELFGYVVGGQGLFGVILEAELKLTDNEILTENSDLVDPSKYLNYFIKNVKRDRYNRMHLYRLSIDPNNFFKEGIAVNYSADKDVSPIKTINFQKDPKYGTRFERIVMNLARRFSFVRNWFWSYEKRRLIKSKNKMTTNTIMHPAINAMFNNSISESEWLQEYFVPGDKLEVFLKELAKILTKNEVKLVNATVRYVDKDNISQLSYAKNGKRFAVVLCFNQSLSNEAVVKTKKWIRQAIDLTLQNKGAYYLPYLAFATNEQFLQSYPNASHIHDKKLEVDPDELFSSGLYEQYIKPQAPEFNAYKNIMHSSHTKKKFAKFLENVLERIDSDKFYALLEDIMRYSETSDEIYDQLLKRMPEISPNIITTMYRINHSLNAIVGDLSDQAVKCFKSRPEKPIKGMIEIGYPGRFVNSFKEKLNIVGPVSVVNYEESIADYVQTGFPRPYDKFVGIQDYSPLSEKDFSNKSVDLVTCFIGLHHLPDNKVEAFVESLNRVLTLGGSFLLVDHDIDSDETRTQAHLAHSIYNAVMGTSLEEEKNEVRNFRPMSEWIALLKRYGFELDKSAAGQIRNGDPTRNTMVRFVKKKDFTLAKPFIDKCTTVFVNDFARHRAAVSKRNHLNQVQQENTQSKCGYNLRKRRG